MAHIVTVSGSPSLVSRSGAMLEYFRSTLEAQGHTVHASSIRDIDAHDLLYGRYEGETIKAYIDQVSRARGIIVATPVYKAAYTGVLKLFLDVLPTNALGGKIALPIVSGAAPHHALVLDYALKPVLAALGTSTILPGIYVIDNEFIRSEAGGTPMFTPELAEKLTALCQTFIEAL